MWGWFELVNFDGLNSFLVKNKLFIFLHLLYISFTVKLLLHAIQNLVPGYMLNLFVIWAIC